MQGGGGGVGMVGRIGLGRNSRLSRLRNGGLEPRKSLNVTLVSSTFTLAGRVVFVRVEEESVLVSSGIWFVGCYFMSVDVRWGVGHLVGENTKARTVKEVYKSLQ